MPARKPKLDEKPQFEQFLETVRQVGADETDRVLERALDRIAEKRRRGASSASSLPPTQDES